MQIEKITNPKKVSKEWGTEEIIVNDIYCAKIMTIQPRGYLSLQYHLLKTETFHILSGILDLQRFNPNGTYVIDVMKKGDSVTIHAGQVHRFFNRSSTCVVLLEISTKHDDDDVYRVTQSGTGVIKNDILN